MPSQLYPSARQLFRTAQLSWLVGDYKAILLPEAYIPDFADVFLADVSAGVRIATSDLLENKTVTEGVCSCDPIHFGILVDSRNAAKMLIYKHTGDEATSNLIVFLDSTELLGTPLPLVGFDYFYVPSSLEGGIFR